MSERPDELPLVAHPGRKYLADDVFHRLQRLAACG